MLKNSYICAVDIGSTKIAAVVAEIKQKKVASVFFEMVASKGVRQGTIVNSIELVGALERLLSALRRKSGIKIKFIYANISGQDVVTKHSRAIIPLAERGNKVITPYDIHKVNEQARILASSLNEEIIDQVPFGYTIDSKNNVLNPLGLYSHKLETDLFLICGKLAAIQSLIRAVNQAGFQIKDLFFSGMATATAIFPKQGSSGQTVLLDIGSDSTEVLLFKDGFLRTIDTLGAGGDDVTAALSGDLKIPFALAEEVKLSHVIIGDTSLIPEEKEVLVKKDAVYKSIQQRAVSRIATDRALALCQAIAGSIEKATPLHQLDGVIAVGRSSMLDGFLEMLESHLMVPVRFGRVTNPDIISLFGKEDAVSGKRYLPFVTALGIVCKALQKEQPQVLSQYRTPPNLAGKFIDYIKEMYHEYF